jgi:hypothetical protein
VKLTGLVFFFLLAAISTASQTAKQHVNLGMSIDEFVARFDVSRADTPQALAASAAAHEAINGGRASIQLNLDGRKTTFVFDKGLLCEMEITAGNTFAHELRVLTEQLGTTQASIEGLAVWDREDGTRFILASRAGKGVLIIEPTPTEDM